MNSASDAVAFAGSGSNPFSTRFTRPGALPFHFSTDASAPRSVGAVADRFFDSGRRGELIGRHGSGKTTLLLELAEELRRHGESVRQFTLRGGQRSCVGLFEAARGCPPCVTIAVDGCEQLAWRRQWWLMWLSRRRKFGLLVTGHRSLGLPTLYRCRTSPALAKALAASLTRQGPTVLPAAEIEAAFARRRGNLREVWFELYDAIDRRRRTG